MLRFEPQPGSRRRLAIRVLQIIEPIRYATTSPDGSEHSVTEGSLLRNLQTGKLLTVNVDGGKRIRDMALLWPENLYVVSFYCCSSFEVCYRPSSTSSNTLT